MLSTEARLTTSLSGESLSCRSVRSATRSASAPASSLSSISRLFTAARSAAESPSARIARRESARTPPTDSAQRLSFCSFSGVTTVTCHAASVRSFTFWSVKRSKIPSSRTTLIRIISRLLKTCLISWSWRTDG